MKIKNLFFSSLLLSTAFVACTNEEIIESSSVDTKDAIALGEGYTINVTKGLESRAAFDFEGTGIAASWEEGDQIGAAWFHVVSNFDSYYNVTNCFAMPGAQALYSNHPFDLIGGKKEGQFQTVTNAFAGAYILYYPYNSTVSQSYSAIPVKIDARQPFNAAAGHELDQITDNMQSYCAAKFVPGGNQTGVFSLQQIPAIFKLHFTATKKLNMNLAGGIAIKKIVLIAEKNGESVLVTKGQVAPKNVSSIDKYVYNENELPDYVAYSPVYTSDVDHFSIDVENGDKSAYKMVQKDVMTVKPFYFSTLPFTEEADKIIVKVVTEQGTFSKEYDADDTQLAVFNNATEEGGVVYVNVKLDVTETDDAIYTEEDFMAAWNEAKETDDETEILVGEDLVLTEGLELDNINAAIKVVFVDANGQDSKDHSIKVPSLTIKNGNVTFVNTLNVEGDVTTTGNSVLYADCLNANKVNIGGDAEFAFNDINKLYVQTSGKVTISSKGINPAIDEIEVEKGINGRMGELTVKNATLSKVLNKGMITLNEGVSLKAGKEFTNNNIVVLNEEFNNYGTFNQNATLITEAAFNNKPGATLNITAANAEDDAVIYVNEVHPTNGTVGTINIQINGTNNKTWWAAGSANYGKINLKKGALYGVAGSEIQKSGYLYVDKNAELHFGAGNVEGGRVVMNHADAKLQYATQIYGYVFFPVSAIENNDWSVVPAYDKAANLIVDKNVTINSSNSTVLAKHNLFLNANLSLNADFRATCAVVVEGTSTIYGTVANNVNFTLTSANNRIETTGSLTLNKVNLIGEIGAKLSNNGTIKVTNGATNEFENM